MTEFKTILLTSDLSENADAAAPYAVELATRFGGTIHLVHVFEDAAFYAAAAASEGMMVDSSDWIAASLRDREKKLGELSQKLAISSRIPVKPVMRQGHAATEIVEAAKSLNADCVVIATHGRTGLSHLVFGSVAERVVRLSPCPVLSVRPKTVTPTK